MRPTIVFGILSAAHRAETLSQLIDSLGGRPVVIHHDFTQQADFSVSAGNAVFVTDPARTGWGEWGLMESLVRTIEFCGEQFDYDYLQFLTPVDLPIRPIEEFEAYIGSDSHDVAVDALSLDEDELAFMAFAYRAFAPAGSTMYRLLWRLREQYFGPDCVAANRAGLSVPLDCRRNSAGDPAVPARLARWLTRRYVSLATRFGDAQVAGAPHVGSSWFGASRQACEYLVGRVRDPRVRARFEPIFCAPEMLMSTVFAASRFRRAPGNHEISRFDGARPVWLGVDDLPGLQRSGKFFARKFPDDPTAPVRLELLASLTPSQTTSCAVAARSADPIRTKVTTS